MTNENRQFENSENRQDSDAAQVRYLPNNKPPPPSGELPDLEYWRDAADAGRPIPGYDGGQASAESEAIPGHDGGLESQVFEGGLPGYDQGAPLGIPGYDAQAQEDAQDNAQADILTAVEEAETAREEIQNAVMGSNDEGQAKEEEQPEIEDGAAVSQAPGGQGADETRPEERSEEPDAGEEVAGDEGGVPTKADGVSLAEYEREFEQAEQRGELPAKYPQKVVFMDTVKRTVDLESGKETAELVKGAEPMLKGFSTYRPRKQNLGVGNNQLRVDGQGRVGVKRTRKKVKNHPWLGGRG